MMMMLAPLVVLEVWLMTDWTPIVAALAVFLTALSTAVPTLMMLWRHSMDIRANGAGIARIETATNGTLSDLRLHVARLEGRLSAFPALPPGAGPHSSNGADGTAMPGGQV